MNTMKRYYLIRLIVTTLFGAAFGLFFFLMAPYASELFDVLVIAMGLLTAVLNLPGVYLALRHIRTRGEWINLVLSLGAVALGVALMLLQRSLLMVLLGIYSVVLPGVRILLVSDRKQQLRRELPTIIAGITMIVIFLTESERLAVRVVAFACFALTASYLISGLLVMHYRFGKKTQKDKVVRDAEFEEKE